MSNFDPAEVEASLKESQEKERLDREAEQRPTTDLSANETMKQAMGLDVIPVTEPTSTWALLQKQCRAFIASGFLPRHITDRCSKEEAVAKAMTIVLKGRELNIPPLQALNSIYVINGRPCLAADLMLALIYRGCPSAKIDFKTPVEKANEECVIEVTRPGQSPQNFRFTIEDAKRAGLLGKDVWKNYPAAMCRARAISIMARAVFPDFVMGCYTTEEMQREPQEEDIEDQRVLARRSSADELNSMFKKQE